MVLKLLNHQKLVQIVQKPAMRVGQQEWEQDQKV